MTAEDYFMLIGGANYDIRGLARVELEWQSSNPARISMSGGGVARNIAENLARMGEKAVLITAVGADINGEKLIEEISRWGVDITLVRRCLGANTGSYIAFLEKNGDLLLGMSDMEVMENINDHYLLQQEDIITGASLVGVDTNLSSSALKTVGRMQEKGGFPLLLETVSVAKAPRALAVLDRVKILATNREELQEIIPGPLKNFSDRKRTGKAVLENGPAILLLKMGPEGLYLHTREGGQQFPALPGELRDATGAGDCLVAVFMAAWRRGLPLETCVKRSLKAARWTLESPGSVSEKIDSALLEEG